MRPSRDCSCFLAPVPSHEWLGYDLSPAGLGGSAAAEFLPYFGFLHNIHVSRSVYYKSAAAGGGGRDDRSGRADETSPRPQRAVVSSQLSAGRLLWKQSQFRGGANVRNKANSQRSRGSGIRDQRPDTSPLHFRAKQSQFRRLSGNGRGPARSLAGGNYAKQTQFPRLCRSGDRRSQGPIVRNKAN